MQLEELPGVGPQLASRIRARFKSDDEFFAAAKRQDLQAIATVEGVTERRAVDLVLAAQGNAANDGFLATTAAKKVHDRILDRLLSYAATDVGRNRLRLLHPLPTAAAASAHMAEVMAAKEMVTALDPIPVRRALRKLQSPGVPTPRMSSGIMVVAESDSVHERLHAMGLGRWVTLGSARDLHDAQSYDVAVIAYDEGMLDATDIPNAVEVAVSEGAGAICPHTVLERFTANRQSIEACATLAIAMDRQSVAGDALAFLDDLSQPEQTPTNLREAVAAVKKSLDSDLASRVEDCSLSGFELLTAISSGRLPPDLAAIMEAILADGRRQLHAATGLRFQPFVAGFPIGVSEEAVDEVLAAEESGRHLRQFKKAQRAAKNLAALEKDLWDEVRSWLEFDATFALGRFALDHDLHAPSFGKSISFSASIHLDLASDTSAQRIAYSLGDDAPVAVLTGANSGGKSTLLEHLTQLVVMARMGLPVVGVGVSVPWLDEVHLVTARRGMDAGAFETFLRGFLPVTTGNAKRLVLADEVEAVTELDAAGRILAWVLDRLANTSSLAVVVTHLAAQVLQYVQSAKVRVDGIEATGLDENHQLIVNRCPVIGRAARSTPELIIRRLAATTRGEEQLLFQALMAAFDGPTNPTSHA